MESEREPENPERNFEIETIQKKVRDCMEGLNKNRSRQMHSTIRSILDDLAPRIEKIVQTGIGTRDTWPSSEPKE